jgi:hypothetical protein
MPKTAQCGPARLRRRAARKFFPLNFFRFRLAYKGALSYSGASILRYRSQHVLHVIAERFSQTGIRDFSMRGGKREARWRVRGGAASDGSRTAAFVSSEKGQVSAR